MPATLARVKFDHDLRELTLLDPQREVWAKHRRCYGGTVEELARVWDAAFARTKEYLEERSGSGVGKGLSVDEVVEIAWMMVYRRV